MHLIQCVNNIKKLVQHTIFRRTIFFTSIMNDACTAADVLGLLVDDCRSGAE